MLKIQTGCLICLKLPRLPLLIPFFSIRICIPSIYLLPDQLKHLEKACKLNPWFSIQKHRTEKHHARTSESHLVLSRKKSTTAISDRSYSNLFLNISKDIYSVNSLINIFFILIISKLFLAFHMNVLVDMKSIIS